MTTDNLYDALITVDIGSTQIRFGRVDMDPASEEINTLPNPVSQLPDKQETIDSLTRKMDGETNLREILIFRYEFTPGQATEQTDRLAAQLNSGLWLSGNAAANLGTSIPLSPQQVKSLQPAAYVNVFSALIVAMANVGKLSAKLFVRPLLPPKEYVSQNANTMRDMLHGSTLRATNILTGQTHVLELVTVEQKAECHASLPYCIIDEDGQLNKLGRTFQNRPTVFFDPGENTMDVLLMLNGSMAGAKMDTLGLGYKKAMAHLRNSVYERHGYTANDTSLRTAFESGYLTIGNTPTDVGELVSAANAEFLRLVLPLFENWLSTEGYNYHELGNFVYVGGGSVKAPNARSFGEQFEDHVRNIVPDIGHHTPPNPRDANILGATIKLREKRDSLLHPVA